MENWNKDHTLHLINLFEDCPCLYNPADINYCNKLIRNKKYEFIKSQLKEVGKVVTTNAIKAKIRTLQTQLARETKKVIASKRSGAGLDDLYLPKLWCYDHLKFLSKYTEGIKGVSNINVSNEHDLQRDDANKQENKTDSSKKSIRTIAIDALTYTKKLAEQQYKQLAGEQLRITGEEEDFCRYLCSELKKVKVIENYQDLKWEILSSVRNTLKKEVADMQNKKFTPEELRGVELKSIRNIYSPTEEPASLRQMSTTSTVLQLPSQSPSTSPIIQNSHILSPLKREKPFKKPKKKPFEISPPKWSQSSSQSTSPVLKNSSIGSQLQRTQEKHWQLTSTPTWRQSPSPVEFQNSDLDSLQNTQEENWQLTYSPTSSQSSSVELPLESSLHSTQLQIPKKFQILDINIVKSATKDATKEKMK